MKGSSPVPISTVTALLLFESASLSSLRETRLIVTCALRAYSLLPVPLRAYSLLPVARHRFLFSFELRYTVDSFDRLTNDRKR